MRSKDEFIEKPERFTSQVKDEFKDLMMLAEHSAKKLWDNKEDEIWNEYLSFSNL